MLSGLPIIRREVRGLPDDVNDATNQRYGWLASAGQQRRNTIATTPTPTWQTNSATTTSAQEQAAYSLIKQFEQPGSGSNAVAFYDSEPDIFSYSFAGHSGQFLFDAQGVVHTLPYDPISIAITRTGGVGAITSFVLGTAEGILYTFSITDEVTRKTEPSNTVRYQVRSHNAFNTSAGVSYTTAWHASTIQNALNEQITLTYRLDPHNINQYQQ